MISKALSYQTNVSKSFQSFFIEAMELFLTIPNRINVLQMGRFGRSSEQRFRMNLRKKFDWISFNQPLVQDGNPNRRAIAIDPSYISKSGKKTQSKKVFFSTDTGMNAIDIFDVYRTRFHIEFFTMIASNSRDCATASQGMLKQCTLCLICLSLQSTLPDSLERSMTRICPSVMSKCSYTMLKWLNEYFQRSEKART